MANYIIIGGDGVQRGPVSSEDVRQWMAEGRLSVDSKAQVEGSTEWVTLGQIPEFAGGPTSPPPLTAGVTPGPSKLSAMAVLSIVLAPLGLLTCGITTVIGLILGIIALVKISNSRGALRGMGVAITGLCLSIVFLFILPLFAAMALPAFAAAKMKAESIVCLNNERQMAQAMQLYATGHTNQLPPAATWCDDISGCVDTNAGGTRKFSTVPPHTTGSKCDYAFNSKLSGLDISKVPPATVMLFESDGGWNASGGQELMINTPRHRFYSVVFADGSVRMVPAAQLNTLRWDP